MKAIKVLGIFAIVVLLAGWGIARSLADELANRAPGETVLDAILGPVLAKATKGKVKCTAAINSDGTVAQCFLCNRDPAETRRITTGQYEVAFSGVCSNVTANLGFSRWVQPDTLGTAFTDAYCTTADRAGDPTSIFVGCKNASGFVDTSFFLFVAK